MPFSFPVRFQRNGDLRVIAIIPNGTWILPYDHKRYMVQQEVQMAQQRLLVMLEENPVNPQLEWRLMYWTTMSVYKK